MWQSNHLYALAEQLRQTDNRTASTSSPGTGDDGEIARLAARIEHIARRLEQAVLPTIGTTPRTLVWRKNKSRLYRYACGNRRFALPLFIVYGLIKRPTILDLTPDDSLIAYLCGAGFDVYLLDWGEFGPEDVSIGLPELLFDHLPRAIRAMQQASASDAFHLLGYCMGGTLAAVWAALHPQAPLASLVLIASPIDFAEIGEYRRWLDPSRFDPEELVRRVGNIPGHWLTWANLWLRPLENIWTPLKRLLVHGDDDEYLTRWLALNRWLHDNVPFPGTAFVQWIRWFYQENRLAAGGLEMRCQPVRLSNIACPLLVFVSERDHLVPPGQSLSVLAAVSSREKRVFRAQAGHVSLVVGRYAREHTWPMLREWLAAQNRRKN